MTYETVFDLANGGYDDWWFPCLGFIALGVGGFFLLTPEWISGQFYRNSWPRWLRKAFAWYFVCFGIIWAAWSFVITYGEYLRLHKALATGQFRVVEGTIENFVPMDCEGRRSTPAINESFDVGDTHFEYCQGQVTAAFNRAGIVHAGTHVRIAYVGNVAYIGNAIIKLEIARQASSE